jgi:hypothetical protein
MMPQANKKPGSKGKTEQMEGVEDEKENNQISKIHISVPSCPTI